MKVDDICMVYVSLGLVYSLQSSWSSTGILLKYRKNIHLHNSVEHTVEVYFKMADDFWACEHAQWVTSLINTSNSYTLERSMLSLPDECAKTVPHSFMLFRTYLALEIKLCLLVILLLQINFFHNYDKHAKINFFCSGGNCAFVS